MSDYDYNSPICCEMCGKVKHPREFRHFMTNEQAEMVGYFNNHKHPKGVATFTCASCLPSRTLPESLGINALRQGANGEVLSLRSILLEAQRKAHEKTLDKPINQWLTLYRAQWAYISGRLKADANRIAVRRSYVKRTQDHQSHQSHALDFLDQYAQAISAARAKIKLSVKAGTKPSPTLTWVELIGESTVDHLRELWGQLPAVYLARAAVPMLISKAEPPCLYAYKGE